MNFLLWGHLYISSFRLFSILSFLLFPFKISSFSLRHTSHFFSPLSYFLHFFKISHSISALTPLSFRSQKYFVRVVLFLFFSCFMSLLCWYSLCLKSPSVLPMYITVLLSLFCFTLALYTTASTLHSPFSGHSVPVLQLHFYIQTFH